MSDMISTPGKKEPGQTLSWRDGDMPYSDAFGDQFYCKTDGRAECDHVFIEGNDLKSRFARTRSFTIGELGFGTGLNFCETWRQWQDLRPLDGHLHFVSFELYPMHAADIGRALAHWTEIKTFREKLVAAWPQDPKETVTLALDPQTRLTVVCGPALAGIEASSLSFNAWYLDGFAPSKNPDMWSDILMQAVFRKTAAGGTFATYAAAGFVRRNLIAAGFRVEKRKGFAGKREMLFGQKLA